MTSPKKTIKINGREHEVLDSLGPGPGCTPNHYELHGFYVFQVGPKWLRQDPGQYSYAVTVEVLSCQ